MTCYFPLTAYRVPFQSKLVFNRPRDDDVLEQLQVPCGQCIGCRLERSRQWAVRCIHEAQTHSQNCFVTLTYSPLNLPSDLSLHLRDFQLFMKRLRKRCGSVRFFHCGEYGESFGRPHYHALFFGFRPPDLKLFTIRNEMRLYTSDLLSELWGLGFVSVGDVTFESAAYVARYVLKKVTGDAADAHYTAYNFETGEIITRRPEYVTMSRRPGIGSTWFDRYSSDVFPSDSVVVNGRELKVPRYYDNLLKLSSPYDFEQIHFERYKKAKLVVDNNTEERLIARHEVQQARLRKLPRSLE